MNSPQAAFRSVIPTVLSDPSYNNAGLGQPRGTKSAQPNVQLNAKPGLEAVQCYKCKKFGHYARDCAEETTSGTVQILSEAELLEREIANQCVQPPFEIEELQGQIKVLSSDNEEASQANEGPTERKILSGQGKRKRPPACFKCSSVEHLMDACPHVSEHYKAILRARRQENLKERLAFQKENKNEAAPEQQLNPHQVVDLFQTLDKINVRQGSLLQTLDKKVDQLGEEIRQRDCKMVAVDLPEFKGPQAQHVCARTVQGEQSTPDRPRACGGAKHNRSQF